MCVGVVLGVYVLCQGVGVGCVGVGWADLLMLGGWVHRWFYE